MEQRIKEASEDAEEQREPVAVEEDNHVKTIRNLWKWTRRHRYLVPQRPNLLPSHPHNPNCHNSHNNPNNKIRTTGQISRSQKAS